MEDLQSAMESAEHLVDNWRAAMKRINEIEQTGMSIREQLDCPELAQLDLDLRSLESCAIGTLMGLVDALRDTSNPP